jgi:hypothetical protein
MAFIAMLFVVRSSEGANCTSATFVQEVSNTTLTVANLIAEDYATLTSAKILALIRSTYDPNVINLNLSISTVDDVVSISYKLIFACNETIITVLPDGAQQVTQVTTNVDQDQLQSGVAAGLSLKQI